MSKDMWIAEHEAVGEDFVNDLDSGLSVDEAKDKARAVLRSLGFDPHEIEDQIAALEA